MKYDYITWDTIIVCANNADWIPSMCFDRTSELWFGVLNRNVIGKEYGGGLFRFKDSKIDHFHINNSELPSNSVVDIAIDNFNNKWIGTYNGGLAKFCADGTWKLFNRENTDMPYNQSVEHIVIDKRNNVWLALWWTGLAKLTEGGK
ncbi:MAG: hypothetical protein HC905_31315 [Bacteroidales bacterium]|nr:hypothetical protein [Bacteroidales bacterium]